MTDRLNEVRQDFGDAFAHLRALHRDDDDLPRACDRVVELADTVAGLIREARDARRAARRNSRTPLAGC